MPNCSHIYSLARVYFKSRGSSVDIATGHGIYSISSRSALGPMQPPMQWVPETLSQEVKRQELEADH
jgi:hypothetical protein